MFRNILYPMDFSDSAKEALKYIIKLKEAGTKEVILLHVYDIHKIDIHWEIEAQLRPAEPLEYVKHDVIKQMLEHSYERLKEIEKELTPLFEKVELIVEEGVPYQKIVETAEDLSVSLIVMGSHGESGFVNKILGTTTDRVIAHSTVPVLVVKPHDSTL